MFFIKELMLVTEIVSKPEKQHHLWAKLNYTTKAKNQKSVMIVKK
jgi:hypothetical protein